MDEKLRKAIEGMGFVFGERDALDPTLQEITHPKIKGFKLYPFEMRHIKAPEDLLEELMQFGAERERDRYYL